MGIRNATKFAMREQEETSHNPSWGFVTMIQYKIDAIDAIS